jgi:hypothetical protein
LDVGAAVDVVPLGRVALRRDAGDPLTVALRPTPVDESERVATAEARRQEDPADLDRFCRVDAAGAAGPALL